MFSFEIAWRLDVFEISITDNANISQNLAETKFCEIGAETNCGIARILGILRMNSYGN